MGDVFVQGAALLGMVILAAVFVVEARKWRAIDSVIGRRQRIVRIWLIILIEVLLAMMVLGPWIPTRKNAVAALIYWAVCLFMLLAVVVLAFVDLREVTKSYSRINRGLFQDLTGRDDEEK